MAQFLLPKSFDSTISLLTCEGETQNTCQNIQIGTKPIDILGVKFREKVRLLLRFRDTRGYKRLT